MFRGVKVLLDSMMSVVRISAVLLCALFVPRFFIHYVTHAQPHTPTATNKAATNLKLGLENISEEMLRNLTPKKDLSYRVGLVTNHTGKDQLGCRNIDILLDKGVRLTAIFTPQHGFNADMREGKPADDLVDKKTNLPILSWYDTSDFKNNILSSIDVIMFDIQDSGMRHGYTTALLDVMKCVAVQKKKLVVLDRPNLLGSYMEGALGECEQAHIPVPIRHGMTVGELAYYFNQNLLTDPVDLQVIPMEHYSRRASDMPMGSLSPNLTNLASCYGYSFLGLLGEIAPFDIGVGTDKAFQCLLLPESCGVSKKKWYSLRDLLKKHGIESKYYCCFNERKKSLYAGLKIHVTDINNFSSFNTLLAVLNFFKDSGTMLTFSPRFDSALGTDKVRAFFEGDVEREELEMMVNTELTAFFAKAMNSFIYKPLPQMVRV